MTANSFSLVTLLNTSGDYWGDFDYSDSIAIVGRTIAIVVILLGYYCDSCDTIEYIEVCAPQASSGSMACILKHGGAYSMGNSSGCWYLSF